MRMSDILTELSNLLKILECLPGEKLPEDATGNMCEYYEAILQEIPDVPTRLKLKRTKYTPESFSTTWIELLVKVRSLSTFIRNGLITASGK